MSLPRPRPLLYEINTRPWLKRVCAGVPAPTLRDIPDAVLDEIAAWGFDWVWLMGVWETGPLSQAVSRTNPSWRAAYERVLPDLTEDDICGSGFAVCSYTVRENMGGNEALAHLRARLAVRGIRLMLDFVPNHTGLDHPWVRTDPAYYVAGTEEDITAQPQNYIRMQTDLGERILAHGRDPYFDGWLDTLQLDYSNQDMRRARTEELVRIASQCDGVRCDMAMLMEPDVFERTWHRASAPFWPDAICAARTRNPDFLFLAEVYWDREYNLLQEGFDYCYDKRFYDRLRSANVSALRAHLTAPLDYFDRLAHFLENHDEERAATCFTREKHFAAAVLCYLAPGMRFVYEGQCAGNPAHLTPHLCREPAHTPDAEVTAWYRQLLPILQMPVVREGVWHLAECAPTPDGDAPPERCIAYLWEHAGTRLVAIVNYGDTQAHGTVALPTHAPSADTAPQCLLGVASSLTHTGNEAKVSFSLAPWQYSVMLVA